MDENPVNRAFWGLHAAGDFTPKPIAESAEKIGHFGLSGALKRYATVLPKIR